MQEPTSIIALSDALALLGLAFTAWGGIVYWLGRGIRADLKGIRKDLASESAKLNQYIVTTEARLAVLEDRVINHEK